MDVVNNLHTETRHPRSLLPLASSKISDPSSRINHPLPLLLDSNHYTRLKHLKVECFSIQPTLTSRIGREHDLKSSIQQKPFDLIGPEPTSYGIPGFKNTKRYTARLQLARAGQTSQAGANDHDRFHGVCNVPTIFRARARPEIAAPSTRGPPKASPQNPSRNSGNQR